MACINMMVVAMLCFACVAGLRRALSNSGSSSRSSDSAKRRYLSRADMLHCLPSDIGDVTSTTSLHDHLNVGAAIPRHVAFIVDGNGRWAARQGLDRHHGHAAGATKTVDIAKRSFALGVQVVTLYLFSTENWSRPRGEVESIMTLLERYLLDVASYLRDNDIRLCVIGQLHRLPASCQLLIQQLSVASSATSGAPTASVQRTLCLALSYGGRDELVQVVRDMASNTALRPHEITESLVSQYTATGRLGIPDPDLVIRTSGETRLSNFLLWQSAYSELLFVDRLWPDWSAEEAELAILGFARRERRFGK